MRCASRYSTIMNIHWTLINLLKKRICEKEGRPKAHFDVLGFILGLAGHPKRSPKHPKMLQDHPHRVPQERPRALQRQPGATQDRPTAHQNHPTDTQEHPIAIQEHPRTAQEHPRAHQEHQMCQTMSKSCRIHSEISSNSVPKLPRNKNASNKKNQVRVGLD